MEKINLLSKNNKGQTGGLINSLVFGVGSLVIGVIIAFVVVSTLTGAGLITATTNSRNIANESFAASDTTVYTTSVATATSPDFTSWNATVILNGSTLAGDNETLVEGVDYQVFTGNGTWGNLTSNPAGYRVSFSYVVTDRTVTNSVGNLSSNFSEGVNNVSTKIPTVLLVAAIVLILGVLAILVGVWQRMRMGGSADL